MFMFADRVIAICVIVFAALYLWATSQIPSLEIGDPLGPKAFPDLLGIGLLLAAVLLFVETIKKKAEGEPEPAPKSEVATKEELGHLVVIAGVCAWTALYYAVFEQLGYILSTTIFLFGLTSYFSRRRWVMNATTVVLFSVGSYALFVDVLGVTLPPGILSL
jgi:putative tricarboxylic transport membrane protein